MDDFIIVCGNENVIITKQDAIKTWQKYFRKTDSIL